MSAMTKIKNMLKEIYSEGDVNAMEIFKGWTVSTGLNGWHYRKFGRSEHIFMGTSVKDAREFVEDHKAMKEAMK